MNVFHVGRSLRDGVGMAARALTLASGGASLFLAAGGDMKAGVKRASLVAVRGSTTSLSDGTSAGYVDLQQHCPIAMAWLRLTKVAPIEVDCPRGRGGQGPKRDCHRAEAQAVRMWLAERVLLPRVTEGQRRT